MAKKKFLLGFSPDIVNEAIVYRLVKDYDLMFNILNAEVLPRKEGILVLELSGEKKNFKAGVSFLKDQGVKVTTADQEVKRIEERCIHCGACTAVCPTGALSIRRPEMSVEFEEEKCSVCELCITACPTGALEQSHFKNKQVLAQVRAGLGERGPARRGGEARRRGARGGGGVPRAGGEAGRDRVRARGRD